MSSGDSTAAVLTSPAVAAAVVGAGVVVEAAVVGGVGAGPGASASAAPRDMLMQADWVLTEAIKASCGSTNSVYGNRGYKDGYAGLLFDHRVALHNICIGTHGSAEEEEAGAASKSKC